MHHPSPVSVSMTRTQIFSTMGSDPKGRPDLRIPSNSSNCGEPRSRSIARGSFGTSCTVSPTAKKSAHSDRFPSLELDYSSVVSDGSPGPRFFQNNSPTSVCLSFGSCPASASAGPSRGDPK